MARGYFKCAGCEESVSVNVGKNRKETDRHCAWLESQGRLCSDCEEKERQAQNDQAAEANAAAGLPALTGSEKQQAWAETIRSQKLETVRKARAGELDGMYLEAFWGSRLNPWSDERALPLDDPNLDYALSLLTAQASASWWIDNRETKIGFILKALFVKTPPSAPELPAIEDAKTEVLAEATIRPTSPLTETVAEIRVHESSIEIIFPEKRDDFWQIVKKELGYEWAAPAWKRIIKSTNGTPADRAAEAGNRLLTAGFIVRIFDPAIRAVAIAGTFPPECTRWIMKRTTGPYSGWFTISWGERNERLYDAARKLKGSKYDKPNVVVPPEHFAEVLDFAGLYSFSLSAGAEEVVSAARAARDAVMTATPVKPAKEQLPIPGGKPAKLTVPAQVEVADEFQD